MQSLQAKESDDWERLINGCLHFKTMECVDRKAPLEVHSPSFLINWGQKSLAGLPKPRSCSYGNQVLQWLSRDSLIPAPLQFCQNQQASSLWSFNWVISCNIPFYALYSDLLLSYFIFLISEMLFVLAWKKSQVHYKEWFEKNIIRQEILCCVCRTCRVIFSPGSIHMTTWHRIKNQQLQEESGTAPPGTRHRWSSWRALTYRECRNQL